MYDFLQAQKKQIDYFNKGATLPYDFRLQALNRLEAAIKKNEEELIRALYQDLNKSRVEAYSTEIGIVLSELGYIRRHLRGWMKSRKVGTGLLHFPSSSHILKEPMGNVLIMSPWNYPVQLTLVPLLGAVAAGCTAFVKPSRYSSSTSAVLTRIINGAFLPEHVLAVEGGRNTNEELMDMKWDFIFFTGSPNVGRIVMEKAARNLTPTTLELGGKSPVIIDESANVRLAASRLAFGKFINAGQTCIAPDYILIHKSRREEFLKYFRRSISTMYGEKALENKDYPKIINEKHFDRLQNLIKGSPILSGGDSDRPSLKIEPTILYPVGEQDPVMQEEIFGPVMPVLEYEALDEAIDFIRSRPKPLALYIFSSNRKNIDKVHSLVSFGGGCINDAIMHIVSHTLPFGGIGESGTGSYHGKKTFDAFTHEKSILDHKTWLDITLRNPPYRNKEKIIRMMLK